MTEDLLGPALRVMNGTLDIEYDFEGYSEHNIFNRLSKSSTYGFYYWPYGYLFRHFKWGGSNSLGFRIDVELEDVLTRYGDHFRVLFFGGSTGYDVLVPGHETLVYHLERQLNRNEFKGMFDGRPVKIFNLSQPGNLAINQLINYIQFGHLIKPQLVISHVGANDLCSMQMNDPKLVGSYHIAYPDVLEAWGKKIHNASDVKIDYQYSDPAARGFRPARERVTPEMIIEAFTLRVNQFAEIAVAQGAKRFIVGYQPWITSKRRLSAKELERKASYNPYYQAAYKNTEILYSDYSDRIVDRFSSLPTANIHNHFRELSDEVDHFGDVCHLLSIGNYESAKCYADKILEILS